MDVDRLGDIRSASVDHTDLVVPLSWFIEHELEQEIKGGEPSNPSRFCSG